MDMNVALIVRWIDQVSKPAAQTLNKVRSFGKGVRDAAGAFAAGFSSVVTPEFSGKRFEENLSRLEERVQRTRARLLGATAQIAAVMAPVFKAGNFQEAFIDFANTAEIPIERMGEIEKRLIAQTRNTAKTKSELLDIVAGYVGKGMDVDSALAAVEATARGSTATKAAVGDMTNAGFAVMDNLKVVPEELRKAFDIMASTAKDGSFEIKDMAGKFPQLTASAQALGMKGTPAVASLAAALQMAMKSAGSADEAANNMANFMNKITAPDAVKNFKDIGVNIGKVLKDAKATGADPLLSVLQIIKEKTGGDQLKIGELFGDVQAKNFLLALLPNLERYQEIRDKAAGAGGIIDKDFANVTRGLNLEIKALTTEIDNLLSSSGALLPIVQAGVRWLTETVRAVNDWTQANPELTATIVKAAAALLLLSAGGKVLSFVWASTALQLFKLIGLFWRFDEAGRNISFMARAARLLSGAFNMAGAGRFVAMLRSIGSALARLSGLSLAARIMGTGRLATALAILRTAAARALSPLFRIASLAFRATGLPRMIGLVLALGRAIASISGLNIAASLMGVGRAAAAFTILRTVAIAALTAIGGLTGPVIAAILAVAAAAFLVWKYWQRIAAFATGLGSGLWDALAPDLSFIGGAWSSLVSSIRGWVGQIASVFGVDAGAAMAAFDRLFDFSGLTARLASTFQRAKAAVSDFLANLFSQEQLSGEQSASIEAYGRNIGLAIGNAITSAAAAVSDAASAAAGYVRTGLEAGWSGLQGWFDSAWAGLAGDVSLPDFGALGARVVDGIISGLSAAWERLTGWLTDKWSALTGSLSFDLKLPSWLGGGADPKPPPAPPAALPAHPVSTPAETLPSFTPMARPQRPDNKPKAAPPVAAARGQAPAAAGRAASGTTADGKDAAQALTKGGKDAAAALDKGADAAAKALTDGARRAGDVLVQAGSKAGQNAGETMMGKATAIGSAIGQAAAAEIRKAAVSIKVQQTAAPSGGGRRDISRAKSGALSDGVDE